MLFKLFFKEFRKKGHIIGNIKNNPRFPYKYESSLSMPVDPNNWFHVKATVDNKMIKTL